MHLPTSYWEWSEEKPCGCLPDSKGSLGAAGQLEAACNRAAPNFPPHIDFLGSHDPKVTIKMY